MAHTVQELHLPVAVGTLGVRPMLVPKWAVELIPMLSLPADPFPLPLLLDLISQLLLTLLHSNQQTHTVKNYQNKENEKKQKLPCYIVLFAFFLL